MVRDVPYPVTPDGRYFLVRDRLWRRSDLALPEAVRKALVADLMAARRAVKHAPTDEARRLARAQFHDAKIGMGERGPVWWTDGAEPVDRHHPRTTPYAAWWAAIAERLGAGHEPD